MFDRSRPAPLTQSDVRHEAAGEAALLLVESLIHGLIGKSLLSVADAVEVINVAADIRVELADDRGESQRTSTRSVDLLTAMSRSLIPDIGA